MLGFLLSLSIFPNHHRYKPYNRHARHNKSKLRDFLLFDAERIIFTVVRGSHKGIGRRWGRSKDLVYEFKKYVDICLCVYAGVCNAAVANNNHDFVHGLDVHVTF